MKKNGLTLIEITIVIAILAILAVVTIPRMIHIKEMRLNMALDKVAADLKYAHEYAINHNLKTRVEFVPSQHSYTVYYKGPSDSNWIVAVDPTGRENFVVTLNTGDYRGVVIEDVSFDEDNEIIFDSIGAPFTSAGDALPDTGSIFMAYVDSATQSTVNVTPVTGRVYIEKSIDSGDGDDGGGPGNGGGCQN